MSFKEVKIMENENFNADLRSLRGFKVAEAARKYPQVKQQREVSIEEELAIMNVLSELYPFVEGPGCFDYLLRRRRMQKLDF